MANRYLLWGRSMGAASALLYAERYPNSDLCGLILDSPFCSFKRLAKDLVTQGEVGTLLVVQGGAEGGGRGALMKTHVVVSRPLTSDPDSARTEHTRFSPSKIHFTIVVVATRHHPCVDTPPGFCQFWHGFWVSHR